MGFCSQNNFGQVSADPHFIHLKKIGLQKRLAITFKPMIIHSLHMGHLWACFWWIHDDLCHGKHVSVSPTPCAEVDHSRYGRCHRRISGIWNWWEMIYMCCVAPNPKKMQARCPCEGFGWLISKYLLAVKSRSLLDLGDFSAKDAAHQSNVPQRKQNGAQVTSPLLSTLGLRGMYVSKGFLASGISNFKAVNGVSIPEPEYTVAWFQHVPSLILVNQGPYVAKQQSEAYGKGSLQLLNQESKPELWKRWTPKHFV